ncbi:unnamed protein product [Ostreobium quekettii]|uniref:Uncharacterized protein n=1 Tax=Ostreobium quekettii TaxID=121088 RepID=A0A8S1J6Q5_9CHLO|nr:unnamed protein product [Ostreobium quekettii]
MGLERLGPLNACSEKKQLSREGQHRGGAGTGEDDGQDLSEWGHVLPKVLDSVLQALADHEAVIFLPSARLVNRNWHQWATHAVKVLDLKVTEPYAKMDRFARQACTLRKGERIENVIKSCPALESLILEGAEDTHLPMLQRFSQLRQLKLLNGTCSGVTNGGMTHVAAMTGLVGLELQLASNLTAQGVRALVTLTCLLSLNLSWCYALTDECVATLCQLPTLTDLKLNGCDKISDLGIAHLSEMPRLMRLALLREQHRDGPFSNKGAMTLGTMTVLVALNIKSCSGVNDAGVAHFQSLTNLIELHLPQDVSDRGLAVLSSLTAIGHLSLWRCGAITNEGLILLQQFSKLAKLEIVSCRGISNWGMGMVGRLTYLKDLTLEGLPINDDGIDELSALTGLKKLSLASTRELRSNGTRRLSGLSALEILDLSGCKGMSDVGVWWLSSLVGLKELHLNGCPQVTNHCVKGLLAMPLLTKLDLAMCTKLTDEGMVMIARLTSLADLDLGGCFKITNAGVGHLARLRFLSHVNVVGCPLVSLGSGALLRRWQ